MARSKPWHTGRRRSLLAGRWQPARLLSHKPLQRPRAHVARPGSRAPAFGCIIGRVARSRQTEENVLRRINVALQPRCGSYVSTPHQCRRRSGMANAQAIDHVLSQAVHAQDVPGVVAMAATDQGILYEGAFGMRELGKDAAMTPDTVVWIASMTKPITSAAAMQLVERGQLTLDIPAADVVSELAQVQVLTGFDASGTPQLRAPKRTMTLKHLLTHTAGFGLEIFYADIGKYQTATGTPGIITCENAALTTPLLFDPGERWGYGINTEWVGKIVEAVSGQRLGDYLRDNLSAPLAMHST